MFEIYNPPRPERTETSPMTIWLWLAISAGNCALYGTKVWKLRSAGRPVGSLHYMEAGLWVFFFCFWAVFGWRRWRRERMEQAAV